MSKLTKAPLAPTLSWRLRDYNLNKTQRGLLERFDKMERYMRSAGKIPPCLRLSRSQYADIDALVRKESQGKRSLSDLRHRDVPILSAAE